MRNTSLHFPPRGATLVSLLAAGLLFLCTAGLAQTGEGIRRAAAKLAPNSLSEQGGASQQVAAIEVLAPEGSVTSETGKSSGGVSSIADDLKPKPMLLSKEELEALLGADPSFIYDSGDKPDPMLVPWTHVRVRSEEYRRVAEAAVKVKDWRKAYESYVNVLRMLDTLPGTWLQMKSMMDLRQKSALDLENLKRMIPPGEIVYIGSLVGEARLPEWVKTNTVGLILSPSDPVCLVGPYTLRVGEAVPGQDVPVVVQKIERDAVTYKVKDKLFRVNLREGE